MTCHSSPDIRLATLINWITLPLGSPPIPGASSLLRTAPPLVLALVFLLMVFAICYFPFHPDEVLTFRTKACAELIPPIHRLS
jgi:hypothetical protein